MIIPFLETRSKTFQLLSFIGNDPSETFLLHDLHPPVIPAQQTNEVLAIFTRKGFFTSAVHSELLSEELKLTLEAHIETHRKPILRTLRRLTVSSQDKSHSTVFEKVRWISDESFMLQIIVVS